MATTTQLAPPPAYAVSEQLPPPVRMPPPTGDLEESIGSVGRSFFPKIRSFWLIVSIYGILMLVMIPIWNCIVLLQSQVYVVLIGVQAPLVFMLLLIGLVCLFVIMLVIFFRSPKTEMQTFQTIVMLASAMLTLLGVVFMLFGHQIAELSRTAQKNMEHNCPFSQATQPLFVEAKMLYALRFHADCAGRFTVEDCEGFKETAASETLKSMEASFKCSTFCAEAQPPDEDYPVTLFSRANYPASCQMTLVRNLRHYVEDMGVQAYFQGCMLVFSSAAIGFLKLLGFCAPDRRFFGKAAPASNYGSGRYVDSRGMLS